MVRRSRLIFCFLLLIFCGILINLFIITQNNPALTVTHTQSKWTVTVATTRGTIYDRNLLPLVNAESEYKAVCTPNAELLPLLKQNTTEATFASTLEAMRNGMPITVPLTRAVPDRDSLRCFITKRRYSNHLLAPHIIGYCQDGVGVTGIELACNKLLNDYSGITTVTYETGADNRYLSGIQPIISDTTQRSVGGVVLTLDRQIQAIVEDAVSSSLPKGTVVVLEPHSGDILACASVPSYLPNSVSENLQTNDGAFVNRALSLYDCGSVFKIITTAAALENGIPTERKYECTGSIEVGGTVFHCHNRSGHGWLDMAQAFSYSCNTYYIQLAQEIGADALYSSANTFGFDRKITLLDGMPTADPLLPSRGELERPAALANLSFGQGYLMTTPLHIAQIIAAVINGGAMPAPRLLHATIDEHGVVSAIENKPSYTIISDDTASKLRYMLQSVVENGTGQNAKPANCTAAGKTGTAETGQLSNNTAVVQSWFAGYFPAEDPQYIVVVLSEDVNNTNVQASSVFREISNNLYELSEKGEIK